MKRYFLIFLVLFMRIFCYGQSENDSIRYYSMMNFIIENKSLIKSYMKFIETHDKTEEYDIKKLCIIQDEISKIAFLPPGADIELHTYYKNLKDNELSLKIREDLMKYDFEETPFDKEFLKRMNKYYDNILRKGKSVNTNKEYWGVLFTASFYDYKSAIMYNVYQLKNYYFIVRLEIVFLFDEENRIKTANISLWFS
jgi:hypothetical protein